jgi:hypothetical protein
VLDSETNIDGVATVEAYQASTERRKSVCAFLPALRPPALSVHAKLPVQRRAWEALGHTRSLPSGFHR